ncbi:hypothetical protein K402DRAFT_312185, partial [Aulographum hederae CBS 113979]
DPSDSQNQSTSGPLNEWKKRPPYKVHTDAELEGKKFYKAECHCGKVGYTVSRKEPLDSRLCHCGTCKKSHASPFQWAAIFEKDDVNFTHGHHDLEWYDPSTKTIEHKLPCKVRCSYCHCPVMDEGRNMVLLFPSLMELKTEEERSALRPRCHQFYGERVNDIPDGLPKWTGLSDESDLVEDSPREVVQKRERQKEEERKKRFEKGENE